MAGSSDPLDFEYDDLIAPVSYFDFRGQLGIFDAISVLTDGVAMTELETRFVGARVTLLDPISHADNGQNNGGAITVDMAGHRIRVDQGIYSYVRRDLGGIVLATDVVDFAATPLTLAIANGTATFDASLTGPLSMQFHTDMSPSYFNAVGEDVMLTFDLDITATPALSGDFDFDGVLGTMDIDQLVANIASGSNNATFDLNGDASVDVGDLDIWLGIAGQQNLASGNPYLYGDANLDGSVDGSDFNAWNANKFSLVAAWSRADFNANGVVDGTDFSVWNSNKFLSADAASVIPEPSMFLGCLLVAMRLGIRPRRVS